jgi:hypothetical protein
MIGLDRGSYRPPSRPNEHCLPILFRDEHGPNDLIDHFMYAPWNRPETYLDPIFRQNTSGFASADQNVVNRRLAELRKDLESGAWDARYRDLRARTAFDAGFRFVAFRLF